MTLFTGTTGITGHQKIMPVHPAMVAHYRNNVETISNLLSEWLSQCGLISLGVEHENITKRQMKSHLTRLFKAKTDVFMLIYVGMSTIDGAWLFNDGTIEVGEIASIMEQISPDSRVFSGIFLVSSRLMV